MKTIVLGKIIENFYEVDTKQKEIKLKNGELTTVYTDKPRFIEKSSVKEWVEICSYDGEPRFNINNRNPFVFGDRRLNISEDEEVVVESEVFRADTNEVYLKTEKIIDEVDVNNKKDMIIVFSEHNRAFNSAMITSNEKLRSYCDIHKLPYEDTDAIKLFKVVFPENQYEIIDGVIMPKNECINRPYSTFEHGSWITTASCCRSN